ncbi:hypothetical protein ACI65C_013864 [Semiaphis heraclei]
MLSTTLQSKSATLGKAKETINGVIKSFEQLRCEDEFYKFWKKIELMAEEFNITLQINQLGEFIDKRDHEHAPDAAGLESRKVIERIKKASDSTQTTRNNISEAFSQSSMPVAARLPSTVALSRTIQRSRNPSETNVKYSAKRKLDFSGLPHQEIQSTQEPKDNVIHLNGNDFEIITEDEYMHNNNFSLNEPENLVYYEYKNHDELHAFVSKAVRRSEDRFDEYSKHSDDISIIPATPEDTSSLLTNNIIPGTPEDTLLFINNDIPDTPEETLLLTNNEQEAHPIIGRKARVNVKGDTVQYRNYIKTNGNSGNKYVTNKGKTVESRCSKELPNCRAKCNLKIDDELLQVCKGCFLKIFGETTKFLRNVCNKKLKSIANNITPDKRGHTEPKNKRTPEDIQAVRDHIEKLPTYESHYCRKVTRLKVKNPKKDTCAQCDRIKMQLSNSGCSSERRNELNIEKKNHQDDAEEAYSSKRIDSSTSTNNKCVLSFDLQQCLPTPLLESSVAFYKRQLWTYNLTVHNINTSKASCFIWSEPIAKRGGNDIESSDDDQSYWNPKENDCSVKTKKSLFDSLDEFISSHDEESHSIHNIGSKQDKLCDRKWRNLCQTYKANVKKSNSTGTDSIIWEYYNDFNEHFGAKDNINPPATNLKGSFTLASTSKHNSSPAKDILSSKLPVTRKSPLKPSPKKQTMSKKRSYGMDAYIDLKREEMVKMEEHQKRLLSVRETEAKALSDIASALKCLADKS